MQRKKEMQKMTDLYNKVHFMATEELNRANKTWPQFRSKHEAIGVLDEEIFEMNEEIEDIEHTIKKLRIAVYKDLDIDKPLKNLELGLALAIAEGIQCLAMCKKFRCFLESEGKKDE